MVMTKVQRDRRGNAIARAVATSTLARKIVDSQWLTLTRYAKERLFISQPALSRYMNGSLETPAEVADQVYHDFGLTDRVWPRPPSRRYRQTG